MTVTEVGGDEFENVVDRSGMGTNENAAWVNAPGELGSAQDAYFRRLDNAPYSNPAGEDFSGRHS